MNGTGERPERAWRRLLASRTGPFSAGWGLLIGFLLVAGSLLTGAWVTSVDPEGDARVEGVTCDLIANPAELGSVVDLEFAGDKENARCLLAGARADSYTELYSGVRRDYVFIAFYTVTLLWLADYGRRNFRMAYTRAFAGAVAGAAVLAGALDVVENLWLSQMLDSRGADDEAARYALAATIPKWLIIAIAVPVALIAFLSGARRLWRALVCRASPDLASAPDRLYTTMQPWRRPAAWSRRRWNEYSPGEDGERKRVGVCFSGGGIRSASFNLGVLQVLSATADNGQGPARKPKKTLLGRVDYLSCVSGGAYIAGALQALAHQSGPSPDPALFAAGTPEEQHVRLHGRYIADTAGEWTRAILRLVVGLLLNLLVLFLVLVLIARPIGWAQYQLLFHVRADQALEPTPGMWIAFAGLLVIGLGVAVYGLLRGSSDRRRRDTFVPVAGLFLTLAGGVLLVVWALPTLAREIPGLMAWIGKTLPGATEAPEAQGTAVVAGAGIATQISSLFAAIGRKKPPKAEREDGVSGAKTGGLGNTVLRVAVGAVLVFAVVAVLSMLVQSSAEKGPAHEIPGIGIADWIFVLAAAGVLGALYFRADQVRWSLYPFYKRRLATAFAITRTEQTAQELDDATPTTLSVWGKRVPGMPRLLICASANLSGTDIAPPGRRAVPFVFGPDYVGGPQIGWARTIDLEATLGPNRDDASLLGAVAISGAAFASAMGRHSKGSLNALIAISNARLGAWIPSPRYIAELHGFVAEPQYREPGDPDLVGSPVDASRRGPWVRIRRFPYLFKEIAGTYSPDDKFLYLTDGGHYENLGLVELFRRRCRTILCFDASGDDLKTCGTFVEAVSLAREELGVEVKIEHLWKIAPHESDTVTPGIETALADRFSTASCVRASFSYADGKSGTLILAKASLTAGVPTDVLAHAARQSDKRFPNDPTSDQWFDVGQFEAYRGLGHHIAGEAVDLLLPGDLPPRSASPPIQ